MNDTDLPLPEDYTDHGKHYSEDDFWHTIQNMPSQFVGLVLSKALLCREMMRDEKTPLWAKGMLIGVLGYLIFPFDLIPDLIPGVGYLDDVAALGLVLAQLDHFCTAEAQNRAEQLCQDVTQRFFSD